MPLLAVVAVAAVLLLLLFLLASPTFRQAMHDTIAGIPLIGGWLADNNARLIVFLYARMATWADSALGALSSLIHTLADLEYATASQLENLASAAHESTLHLRNTVIPAAVTQAENYAEGRLQTVGHRLEAGIAATANLARQTYAAAIARMDREYLAGINYGQRLALWAAAYAGGLWASATRYSQALFVQARLEGRQAEARSEAYTAAETRAAEEYTAAAFAVAIDWADRQGKLAEGYAEALTGGAILRGDLENVQTRAWAAAGIGAVALAVSAIEDSACMRQCETLGQLGSEINALDLGAILALVEMAAQNPHGTAQFIRRELGPIVDSAAHLVRGLV